tara:strand:+ start:135 stop:566 length:432 start_codon:yes stop_codon:yes gene_type:complete
MNEDLINIQLSNEVYDKDSYEQLVDTSFSSTEIAPDSPNIDDINEELTVEDFFDAYNELFYEIPQNGEINSHQFLIQKSGNYINFDPNQEEIEALQKEIGELRTELLQEQQKNIELQAGVSPSNPTITQGNTTNTNSPSVSTY